VAAHLLLVPVAEGDELVGVGVVHLAKIFSLEIINILMNSIYIV
jgi:hypothetical protein